MRQVGLFLSLVAVNLLTLKSQMALGAMSGATSTGDASPWRMAAFILCALVIIAVVLLTRHGRPAFSMLLVLGSGALVVIGVALLQAHIASQPGSSSGMDMSTMSDVPGKGVQGRICEHRVALGNDALMNVLGIDTTPSTSAANHLRAEAKPEASVKLFRAHYTRK